MYLNAVMGSTWITFGGVSNFMMSCSLATSFCIAVLILSELTVLYNKNKTHGKVDHVVFRVPR